MELEELFDLIEAGDLAAVQGVLAKEPDLLNQQEEREGGGGRSALYVAIRAIRMRSKNSAIKSQA